jgi:hypothetical protein
VVIFVVSTLQAVRTWWSARILNGVALVCVLLTFTIFAECGVDDDDALPCGSGAGTVLNIRNVFILLGLIVLSYWIEAPETPIVIMTGLFERIVPPPATITATTTSTTPAAAAAVATHCHTQKTLSSDTTTPPETEIRTTSRATTTTPDDTKMQVVSGSTRGHR